MSAEAHGTTKIALADRASVLAMNALSPQDYFGLLAVDTRAHATVPLAKYASKEENAAKILAVDAGGGGIYVYTAITAASFALQKSDAAVKHVILFSEADDAEEQAAGTETGWRHRHDHRTGICGRHAGGQDQDSSTFPLIITLTLTVKAAHTKLSKV